MECCRTAEYMPTGMANVHVTSTVNPVITTVSHSLSPITSLMARCWNRESHGWCQSDRPMSPWARLPIHFR